MNKKFLFSKTKLLTLNDRNYGPNDYKLHV